MEIRTAADLRGLYKAPGERALRKQLTALDAHCRTFIAHSPFLVMGTGGANGRQDVSPKGDAPGFVAVLDDHTLLVPDRLGNNRLDGMTNMLENPHVSLIFFVPGVNETLRVNGTARITADPALLAPLAVQGKQPATGLVVQVQEAFLHCAKALLRSHLWDPDARVDRATFPSPGTMLGAHVGTDAEETDRALEKIYRETLY